MCVANGEIYVRSVDVSRQVYTFNVYGISGGAAKEQMPSCWIIYMCLVGMDAKGLETVEKAPSVMASHEPTQ